MKSQRGGFLLGLIVGLLVGLAVALGVALYITKAPVPFINKVPQRTAEQDSAEAERNRHWDPNAPLGPKTAPRAAGTAAAVSGAAPASAAAPALGAAPARDPAAILSGGSTAAPATAGASRPAARSTAPAAEAFQYYVQAGAFGRPEEAEQQRAKLAMLGMEGKVSEREQAGRMVYRVRVGPFATREDAEAIQSRLVNIGIEARLVRVEKP